MKLNIKLMFLLIELFVMTKTSTTSKITAKNRQTEKKLVNIIYPQRKLTLTKFGERFYYFGGHFKLNWFQAFLFCRRHAMELATIITKEEDTNIRKLLTGSGLDYGRFWTSGTDLGEQGKYHWVSNGELIIYTNWAPNQPDNTLYAGEIEHCIELSSTDHGKTFLWNDALCNTPQYFICQL